MGTNYFARIIPTKERKSKLCEMIQNSEDNQKIIDEVNNLYGEFQIIDGKPFGGIIHLGKFSYGWKFLWNPNIHIIKNGHLEETKYEYGIKYKYIKDPNTYYTIYSLTKKGIYDFINQPNIEVFNEYQEKQNKEEFFNMTLNTDFYKNHITGEMEETYDSKKYYLENNTPEYYNREEFEAIKFLGYKIEKPYHDFYSDGLRFSTTNNFG